MADKDKTSGMKSAYELALERMEKQGIERPREEGFSAEVKEKMNDLKRQAEAKLAELEILHRDRLGKTEPAKRQDEEEEYVRERRRIEDDRDRKIERLRE